MANNIDLIELNVCLHQTIQNSLSLITGAGDDRGTEGDFLGSFCLERKIDLTGYIKWWGVNKTRQPESSSKAAEDANVEDAGTELKTLEHTSQATEPYKAPNLSVLRGTQRKEKEISSPSSSSALSILSQSPAFKSLEEKVLKIQESCNNENDENANRNIINMEKNHGKAIEKPVVSHGVALGGAAVLSRQKSMYPLTSLLTAPLLTNYNTLDPLADPILWTPFLPSGSSHTSEVRSYLSMEPQTSEVYYNTSFLCYFLCLSFFCR